jgi:FkbM family methyltransferase
MNFRNWPQFFHWLHETGFKPKTIVDIGVATDTEEMYQWFPESKFIFVEPLKEFEPSLQNLISRYNGNYILAAAGSYDGEIEIDVTADLGGSSIFAHKLADDKQLEEALGMPTTVKRTVPIWRLDNIWEAFEAEGAALLKIDVQGAELEVLKGAENCLDNFEIILLEIGLTEHYIGQPVLIDYIKYMDERGYSVIDFINAGYANNGILMEVDAVFAKKTGWLYSNNKDWTDYNQAKNWNNYKGVRRIES